jgi:hypothetical protein
MKKSINLLHQKSKNANTESIGNVERVKVILVDHGFERPEYIEMDKNRQNNPIIRVQFSDDAHWSGSMAELRKKLLQ